MWTSFASKVRFSAAASPRALLAVALYLGFHGLGFALIALFLWLPWTEASYGLVEPFGVLSFGCALWLLWAKIPRRRRFEAPGPELARADHPRLFALLDGLAAEVGARPVDEVYLMAVANAMIGYRRRWGWRAGSRSPVPFGRVCYVAIGFPMLTLLDVRRLRAILAHELGHHHAGDLRLGPWVYSTRASLATAIERLETDGSPLHLPFLWYSRLFLRISMAISRRQELAADALSARLCGRAAAIGALDWAERDGVAWNRYWRDEVVPLLRRGFQPPLVEGWRLFLAGEAVAAALAQARPETETSPDDTHPSHADRLAALEKTEPSPADLASPPGDLRPAAELLGADVEEPLFRSLLVDPNKSSFERIEWADVAEKVWLPGWQAELAPHAEALRPLVPLGIPAAVADLDALAPRLRVRGPAMLSPLAERNRATFLLGFALASWLRDHGWTAAVHPGIAICFTREGRTLEPLDAVRRLADGRLPAADFLANFEDDRAAVG